MKTIEIFKIEKEDGDGVLITFSDETIAGCGVEDLLGLRPFRDKTRKLKRNTVAVN